MAALQVSGTARAVFPWAPALRAAWRAGPGASDPPRRERDRALCRAAAPERDRAVPLDAAAAAPPPPLPLSSDDAALQASHELQELCRLQLGLLVATLQLSLRAAAVAGGALGSMSDSLDDEVLLQQLGLEPTRLSVRATAYCRAPASLQTGKLQLQLVASSGDGDGGSGAAAAAAQRFLFLGQEGASMAEQEAWILGQPVIVLPDSGGLVLPLAHNGFLVGLLVVERCDEGGDPLAAGTAGAAAAAAAASGAAGPTPADGSGEPAGSSASSGMPQPPACLLFRSSEVKLLKQTAAVLALACAMDMRAALERVGAAVRQRQASALVQAAKKPLNMMRTLGTMLLPRLEPGEPDRDFAQGILEQGSRLQEVVSQLQAALHPAAATLAVPPALQASSGSTAAGWQQRPALPGSSTNSSSSSGGGSSSSSSGPDQWQLAQAPPARPALPSSSIGGDWGSDGSSATIDMSIDEASSAAQPSARQALPRAISSASSSASASSSSSALAPQASSSRASADLLNVLMPLLASAGNFAAVSGVSFVMAEHGGADLGPSPAADPSLQLALPTAEVAVGPGKLKRMLSQLIDGIIACATRGDLVQASVRAQPWHGRPGVAVTLCCCYGLAHGSSAAGLPVRDGSGSPAVAGGLPRPPLQPEFAFLQSSASQAGGWFEVVADATPDVAHLNSSALAATLWLPVVTASAGWS